MTLHTESFNFGIYIFQNSGGNNVVLYCRPMIGERSGISKNRFGIWVFVGCISKGFIRIFEGYLALAFLFIFPCNIFVLFFRDLALEGF